jgi:nucleotide-binding universal stress UspA family protein
MKTVHHILCPIDFSEFSRHAFDRAVAVARGSGADVTALHVVPVHTAAAMLPYMGPESVAPFPLPEVDLERIKAELKSFLESGVSLPIAVRCEVAEASDVHREILVQAGRLPADLIVMGTHGHSGFHHLLLGSVTGKVLRKAPMPVLTVPPLAPDAITAGRGAFRRILCALDFSDCSVLGLRFAIEFARQHHARLAVVHVVEVAPSGYDPPFAGPAIDLASIRNTAKILTRDRLHSVVSAVDRQAIDIEEIVEAGKPHEWCADLIILGIHGRSAVGRALFGSTVEPVVRYAGCPVLTVRSERHPNTAAAGAGYAERAANAGP